MLFFIFASFFSLVHPENWAVLVAGSNTFTNYRHQADIFHTWQILTKNGFDPSKIIVMAYDDIATASTNPFPGHVYNVPDGPDVYIGSSNIAYRGTNVTAKKFYAVLTGDAATAGGPVLESTADDNVFVYFDDHGASGILAFPTGGYCYAADLFDALSTMHSKNMYKNLLFYVEACYAGSMFSKYSDTLDSYNIYVMTAANTSESSYGEYCGITKYKTCLSNEFSARWMEYSEANDLATTTISEEFDYTKANTVNSHVSEYGATGLKEDKLIDYQGVSNKKIPSELLSVMRPIMAARVASSGRRVSQRHAYLTYLETAAESNEFGAEAAEYQQALLLRKKEGKRAHAITKYFQLPHGRYVPATLTNEQEALYRRAIETYEEIQGRLNEFSFFTHPHLFHQAISVGALTPATFDQFKAFIATL